MQYGLCGERLKVNDEALAKGDFKAMHLNNHQKKSLGLLLHVLFSHPKIFYAPNTTDVNDLIDKVSLKSPLGLTCALLGLQQNPKDRAEKLMLRSQYHIGRKFCLANFFAQQRVSGAPGATTDTLWNVGW